MLDRKPRRKKVATVAEVNAYRQAGRYSVGESLILAVSPTGARSWLARIRDPLGKRRDYGLGPFPDVGLAEARERAARLRREVRDGNTPLTKKQRRLAARRVPTFEEAARSVFAERKGDWKNAKHADQWINTLAEYAFPKIGAMTVDAIGAPHVIDVLSPIWRTKEETARRVRQRILAVVDWAFARDFRQTQVAAKAVTMGLGPQKGAGGNHAALPFGEVPALMQRLRAAPETFGRLALMFTILTAARSGEVRGAAWAEIDLKARTWTIPADRMKAGKEHVVPLSDAAVAIVERAAELRSGDLLFPGTGANKPMSDATMAKALREAGVPRERGTVHGMRSAFRDWTAEETNVPREIAELALAHAVGNAVERAYRRSDLLGKRRELMAAWETYLAGTANNVVHMVAA